MTCVLSALTPAQTAALPGYVEKWLNIGLCVEPIVPADAEAAISRCYELAGFEKPDFLYFDSPKASKQYCTSNGLSSQGVCWGSIDSYWLCFYGVLQDFGVDFPQLEGLFMAAQACGRWLPFEGLCLIEDRPTVINMVDGRLHCEDGPSIRYKDGFSIYSIEGVRVDEQIVMRPHTQTMEQINAEPNEEVKIIRIERYGWDKYLDQVGEIIDQQRNDIEYGTLETLYRTPLGINILLCVCPSKKKVYALEVGDCTTCVEAQNHLSGGRAGRVISAS